LTDFRKTYDKYTDISKPEEANGLEKIEVYVENPLRRSETFGAPITPPHIAVGQEVPPLLRG
jgi:hypothetical protein